MRNVLRRGRPSPAMVVAFIALLAALSGTAAALPGRGSVTSNDIRTGAVGKRAIRNGSVGKGEARSRSIGISELRNGAVTTAKLQHPVLSARVSSNGGLQRGVGVVSATRVGPGSYRVGFERAVSLCTYQVTPGNVGQNLTAQATIDSANPARVFVSLRNAENGNRTSGEFQVAVFC